MAKKNYVLDTSVYLTDADALFKFDNHDIFIPLKVLEEIDKHKKRQDSVGINARRIIRTLDELRAKGNLQKTTLEKEELAAKFSKIEDRVVSYNEKINSLKSDNVTHQNLAQNSS